MQNEIEEEMKDETEIEQPKTATMVAIINNRSSTPDDIPEDYNADEDEEDGYTEGQIESDDELK